MLDEDTSLVRADNHGPPGFDPRAGLRCDFVRRLFRPRVARLENRRSTGLLASLEEALHAVHIAGRRPARVQATPRTEYIVEHLDVLSNARSRRVRGRHADTAAVRPVVATRVQRLASVAECTCPAVRATVVVPEHRRPRHRRAANVARLTALDDRELLVLGDEVLESDELRYPTDPWQVLFANRPLLSLRWAIQAEALSHWLPIIEFYLQFEVDGRCVQQRSRVFADLQFDVAVAVQVLRLRDVDVDSAHLVAQGEHSTELFLHRPHVRRLLFVLFAHVHGADRLRMRVYG